MVPDSGGEPVGNDWRGNAGQQWVGDLVLHWDDLGVSHDLLGSSEVLDLLVLNVDGVLESDVLGLDITHVDDLLVEVGVHGLEVDELSVLSLEGVVHVDVLVPGVGHLNSEVLVVLGKVTHLLGEGVDLELEVTVVGLGVGKTGLAVSDLSSEGVVLGLEVSDGDVEAVVLIGEGGDGGLEVDDGGLSVGKSSLAATELSSAGVEVSSDGGVVGIEVIVLLSQSGDLKSHAGYLSLVVGPLSLKRT